MLSYFEGRVAVVAGQKQSAEKNIKPTEDEMSGQYRISLQHAVLQIVLTLPLSIADGSSKGNTL
jgi:hypothetical protein